MRAHTTFERFQINKSHIQGKDNRVLCFYVDERNWQNSIPEGTVEKNAERISLFRSAVPSTNTAAAKNKTKILFPTPLQLRYL